MQAEAVAVDPWAGLVQRWREAGLDAPRVAAVLQNHGYAQADVGVITRLAACFHDLLGEQGSEKWTALIALFGMDARESRVPTDPSLWPYSAA